MKTLTSLKKENYKPLVKDTSIPNGAYKTKKVKSQ